MKKVLSILVIALVVIFAAYIVLMAKFEEPLRIDLTNHVQLSVEDQTITLPWYMRVGITYYGKIDGTDMEGRQYTKFLYSLPDVFESSELYCIVCWETGTTIAFMGESRAMFVIDVEFPSICWENKFSRCPALSELLPVKRDNEKIKSFSQLAALVASCFLCC